MFTERWSILRRILPKRITLKKTVALVTCLAKLHNFCISQRDRQCAIYAPDEACIELHGAVPMQYVQHAGNQLIPVQLLGAGEHFDDVSVTERRRRLRMARANSKDSLPRHKMLEQVCRLGVMRPSCATK